MGAGRKKTASPNSAEATGAVAQTSEVTTDGARNTALDNYVEGLLHRMHLTKGARYQAARRHQRRSVASIWSVIALSMYVFSTSTALAIYTFEGLGDFKTHLVIANIIMSAFIIAFSVLEHGKKHDLKGELFLRCAQGIQELRDQLDFKSKVGTLEQSEVSLTVQKYNELIHDFADNHSETDYRTFRINIGRHRGEHLYNNYHALKFWMDCWSIMLFSAFIPPIVIVALYLAAR